MFEFQNVEFAEEKVKETDILICAIGYEERSFCILDMLRRRVLPNNILVFYFEGIEDYPDAKKYLDSLEDDILRVEMTYGQGNEVRKRVLDFVESQSSNESCIHIDYSSMPRNWYYQLPTDLHLLQRAEVFFWYVGGKYPVSYEAYPSAGIESYSVIGRPSLRMKKKRLHVIGLGYDVIRTKALLSILDPEMYSVCAAFGMGDKETDDNVHQVNSQIISQAVSETTFFMEDFAFMVAKLCEIANEYLPLGDVIFVPDGPKPLVMAMSLVPQIIKKEGISCLHVSRNNKCYEPVMVKPTERIFGFTVKNEKSCDESL